MPAPKVNIIIVHPRDVDQIHIACICSHNTSCLDKIKCGLRPYANNFLF